MFGFRGVRVGLAFKIHDEAVDWSIRVPAMASGIAFLGLAGADMSIATAAITAMIGGPRVLAAVRGDKS